ncbi:MAG TPA: hypothetical protein PKC72_00275 [Chitinophagaceae bacterium]|nr:hypothetical protein [Chitinophagaceae bacterium]
MRLLTFLALCLLLLNFPEKSFSQKGDSTTSSGSHFNDSRSRMFWMGSNYRKEWNTPLTVPVINLSTEHGGLTPVKKGGGKQTKSLRLEDPQGRQYYLRSIAKFITSKTLPGDLQSEAAADLVSDGVSASYPYAALSIPVFAEAAGIPHGFAKVVYIPDDPKLGEFRSEFANMMALYEPRLPDSVDKAYDTDEVADKLEHDNDNMVDQMALLRIRILDMFVMDLDRHEGQWTWGAYDNAHGKGKTYFPIAKDRDQAFYINDGVLPGIIKARSLVPQLEGFKAKAKSIERFNYAARNLDRFFLTGLTEQDWRQAVEKFVSQMTDQVIENAIAQQPKEIRDISGPKIIQTLKDRRNYLVEEVMQYYRFISEEVTITASDKNDLFEINRYEDGSILVQVFKVTKEGETSIKMYERKFDPLVTKEIRMFGMDGDDKFVVHGSTDKIKIRMIGGGGEDVFENQSKNGSSTLAYDRANGENKLIGPFRNRLSNDSAVNKFERIYFKYPYQSFFGTIGYNPDDGLFLGPTFKYIRQGFRKTPYKTFHQVKVAFAFSTKAVNASYHNEFISVFGTSATDLVTDISYKGPNNTTNFFGYGVNSVYDKTKPDKFRYYRIRYDLGDITLQLRQRFSDKVMLSVGPTFQFYHMDSTDKLNLKRNVALNPMSGLDLSTVYRRQSYLGVTTSLVIDTRNSNALPDKGVNWNTTLRVLSGQTSASYDKVTQLNSDFAVYFSLIKDWLTLANRFGAGINLGDKGFEFYQAQYLGTEDNLRGYRKYRFAGKSKFYNQTEFRLKLANLRTYLFPAAFGIFAFVDAGRVWVKDDVDDKWLAGYGGGIWFAPLRRIVFTLSYAKSNEDAIPLFGMGFKF